MKELVEALLPIITILVGAFTTIGSAALVQYMSKLGLDKEALNRDALQSALYNAAMIAVMKGVGLRTDGLPIIVPQEAVNYVLKSTPDAVKKFGLTENQIADMIVPKIVAAVTQGDTAPRA
jgi:hypothetical protein